MHKIFHIFSFNKLNTKWGQWQVKLWLKQLILQLILGVKCTKVVRSLQPENSCYSMFFVTIFVFPAQPKQLHSSVTFPGKTGGLEPFSLLKALDKLFQQTLFCPLKQVSSPIPGMSFIFIRDFSQIKQCVCEFHQTWQMEFLKWHFSMWLDWSFYFFPLIFLVWIGTGSFLVAWGFFYLASFLCAPDFPAHSISVCWRTAGYSPARGMREPSRGKEKLLSLNSLNSLSALSMFWLSAGGGGRMESPNFTPLLRTCPEPSTGHSTPSSLPGDDLFMFFGSRARSFTQTLAGGQGWVLFPKKPSLPPSVTLLGLHRAHHSLLLPLRFRLNNCSETEKPGILPTGLKCCVCLTVSESSLSKRCGNRAVSSRFC